MKLFLKFSFLIAAVFFLVPVVQAADPIMQFVTILTAGAVVFNLLTDYRPGNVLGMNGTNNISARESYRIAREMFYEALRDKFPDGDLGDRKCQQWVNNLKLTQGEIRLEVELNATGTIYTFGVTPNQANSNNVQFITEKRLPLQDSICATEMQILVCKPASRTSTAFQLRSYGNPIDFTAAAAAALNQTFYSHGNFTMKVNNDVLVPYRGLNNWFYKPQTQQTAALGAGSPDDQYRGIEDATSTVEPNLVLIGSKNSIPQIELPSNLATVDEFTRAVIIFKGPYAQNSTVVN